MLIRVKGLPSLENLDHSKAEETTREIAGTAGEVKSILLFFGKEPKEAAVILAS